MAPPSSRISAAVAEASGVSVMRPSCFPGRRGRFCVWKRQLRGHSGVCGPAEQLKPLCKPARRQAPQGQPQVNRRPRRATLSACGVRSFDRKLYSRNWITGIWSAWSVKWNGSAAGGAAVAGRGAVSGPGCIAGRSRWGRGAERWRDAGKQNTRPHDTGCATGCQLPCGTGWVEPHPANGPWAPQTAGAA